MEYNSFYGGRQGAPFIISGSFSTIAEMWAAFKQGDEYKRINYDEYVIIDAVNKNDKDNGKIYQRGREYQKTEVITIDGQEVTVETGDAQYVGQIVGPAGPTPLTELISIEDVVEIAEEESQATGGRDWRLSKGLFAKKRYVCMNDECNYYTTFKCRYMTTLEISTCPECHQNHIELVEIPNLMPGVKINPDTQEREFDDTTDAIQYALVSVRDENGHEAYIYVGFTFPYTIIDYTASSVSPYYNRSNNTKDFVNENLVKRVDIEELGEEHPYYEKWHISVPKGIKGDTLKNFRVMEATSEVTDDEGHAYEGRQDDINNHRKILVYDYYDYSAKAEGDKLSIYLGDYNMIDSISEQDGIITIHYLHDDDQNLMTIKYIRNITITPSTGRMVIEYNTKTNGQYDKSTFNLTYVYSASLAQDGTFSYTTTNGSGTTPHSQSTKLTWVENARVQNTGEFEIKKNTSNNWDELAVLKYIDHAEVTATGNFNIYYNTNPDVAVPLATLKYINSAEVLSTGEFNIYYNTGETSQNPLATLKYIDHISMTNTGDVYIYYNTQEDDPQHQGQKIPETKLLGNIKFIESIKGASGYIQINYNNGDHPDFIWQGTTNSTGAVLAPEDATHPENDPEPVFAEGSPWFILEEYAPFSQELQYLESTGEQYINLDIPCQTELKVKMKFAFTDVEQGTQHVFGARFSDLALAYSLRNGNGWSCQLGSDSVMYPSGTVTVNTDYEVEIFLGTSNQYFKVNGVNQLNRTDAIPQQISSNLLYLFTRNVQSSYSSIPSYMKLYYCQVFVNNVLIEDLMPVLDKNNIPCLYDSISDKLFYNQGTGQFLYA